MNRRIRNLSFMVVAAMLFICGIARAEDEHLYNAAMIYAHNGTEWKKGQIDSSGNIKVVTPAISSTTSSIEVKQATASDLNANVSATDLDIRDLSSTSDSVEVKQATASNLNANVSATDLDIRDLSSTSDSVAIEGGNSNAVVVSATDLDMRDLSSSSDSVEVKQSTPSNLNANVSATDLDIRDLSSTNDSISAAQSGTWDIGTVTTLTSITNDVNIADGGNSITVDIPDGSDATLGAKADARSTATDTTEITAMQVLKEISYMEQNPASRAVTNAGTFAVQNTDSIDAVSDKYITAAYSASQTAATVLTPSSGKKVIMLDIVISASAAGTIYLFDNTDDSTTKLTPILSLAANGGYTSNSRKALPSSANDNVIKYTSGSGAAGSIWIHYYEI